jgi:hypothetical protein
MSTFKSIKNEESEFFADPTQATRIDVPAIKGWIEVRDEISIGEERKVFGAAVKGLVSTKDGEQRMDYDTEKVSFGNVVLYVTDWSFKTPLTPDALKNLKPKFYKAIDEAVQAHMQRVTEGNEQPRPESADSPTSASAD